MNPQELCFLQAERETLKRLLKQLPASNVLERQGLKFRKKNVEEALSVTNPDLSDAPAAKKPATPSRNSDEFVAQTGKLLQGIRRMFRWSR